MCSTVDRPASAAQLTEYETIAEVIMLIRIRRQDKSKQRIQVTQKQEVITVLLNEPAACYRDRKTKSRISCGSM